MSSECFVFRPIPSNNEFQASDEEDPFQKHPSNNMPVRNFIDIKTLFLTPQAQ